MSKAKMEGWDYGDSGFFGKPSEEKQEAIAHRIKMEKEGFASIKEDIEPLLKGLVVEIAEKIGTPAIRVTLPGFDDKEAWIEFRYSPRSSFQRGKCKGLYVNATGDYSRDQPSLGRNYSFDFEKNTVKPVVLKKIAKAVSDHLTTILEDKNNYEKKVSTSTKKAQEAAQLLEEAGFEVRVTGEESEESTLIVQGLTSLGVSATGLIFSRGKNEAVPVRATKKNIVEVVQAIKVLRDIVGGRNHEHG